LPRSDKEVFDHLCKDSRWPLELHFLTYATYVFQQYQWWDQFQADNGSPPGPLDISRWIADITPARFDVMREDAARLFDDAARAYLGEEIEAQKQEAVRTSILSEVKAAGSFWRQLATALITAILAPLIIGGMIAAALTYDHFAPVAGDVARRFGSPPAAPASPAPDGATR
jgi:hypothetical protein